MSRLTPQHLKKTLSPLLKRHGIKRAALFGSVARGEATKDSDIDVLVEFNGRKSLLDLVALELALQTRLKRKVDIVTYGSLHPLLKDRILRERYPLYGERSAPVPLPHS